MSDRVPESSAGRALILLLHGFGSSSRAWDLLIPIWRRRLPYAEFCALDAPYACEQGGRKWYECSAQEQNRDDDRDFVASHSAVDQMLVDAITAHRFESRLDRVSLVGFSQGASLALEVLARGKLRVGSVVAFAARLLATPRFQPPRETALLLIHGNNDPIVPEREGRRVEAAFRRQGVKVERHVVEATGHGISQNAAEIGAMFLHEKLGRD